MQLQNNDIAFRQLRHNTRNALQRIICLISEAPELAALPQGAALAQTLIGRICLSSALADSLYAVTQPHENIAKRLQASGRSLVRLFGASDQSIDVETSVSLNCQGHFADVVTQITHELVGNALKHGLRGRKVGAIMISLGNDRVGNVILTVADNGIGFPRQARRGEGLRLAQDLAAGCAGVIILPDPGAGARVVARFPAAVMRLGYDVA